MEKSARAGSLLEPYRVLDLTEEKGVLCTKVLADLGADVIKIESPEVCNNINGRLALLKTALCKVSKPRHIKHQVS